MGGLARRASFLKQARASYPGALVVDTGAIFASDADGEGARNNLALARGLVLMSYDVVNASEGSLAAESPMIRELSGGQAPALVASARTPSASSPAAGSPGAAVKPYVVRESGQVRVAFVGVASPEGSSASGRPALDPATVDALRLLLPEIRRGAEVIVALVDLEPEQAESLALAGLDLDVVLGGRSTTSRPAVRIGRTLVSAAGGPEYVGRLTLRVDAAGKVVTFDWGGTFLDETIPEDPELLALREQYR